MAKYHDDNSHEDYECNVYDNKSLSVPFLYHTWHEPEVVDIEDGNHCYRHHAFEQIKGQGEPFVRSHEHHRYEHDGEYGADVYGILSAWE